MHERTLTIKLESEFESGVESPLTENAWSLGEILKVLCVGEYVLKVPKYLIPGINQSVLKERSFIRKMKNLKLEKS